MNLIFNRRIQEDQLLVADNEMKFRIFDRNTFEILATYLGPIYDSHVKEIVSDTISACFDIGQKNVANKTSSFFISLFSPSFMFFFFVICYYPKKVFQS
jgi:hypothetical protein